MISKTTSDALRLAKSFIRHVVDNEDYVKLGYSTMEEIDHVLERADAEDDLMQAAIVWWHEQYGGASVKAIDESRKRANADPLFEAERRLLEAIQVVISTPKPDSEEYPGSGIK